MPFKFGKKIFFPKHVASPPDKGGLGVSSIGNLHPTMRSNYL